MGELYMEHHIAIGMVLIAFGIIVYTWLRWY